MLDFQGVQIKWLGHASFKILGEGKVIFIDPYQIDPSEPADIILVTHAHFDHCSLEDIDKIREKSTVIVAPADCAAKLGNNVKTVAVGETVEIEGIKVTGVPAYNTHRFRSPGVLFHPKEAGWLGMVLEIGGVKIYHAGDTDKIPEMKSIECDVALLPVGGTYTMDAEEAAEAANLIKPDIAIPMHWGKIVGSEDDAKKFSEKANVEVRILGKKEVKEEKKFVL
ncbi:MAG: MBL fold metallo-hydrolase [Nanoarchaeota archaeon]|nr:MBL fold metallo-hydrolase [Nanoarchaeota archaeon]